MQLESSRLTFKKFTPADFEQYYGLVSQESVMRYISGEALDQEAARRRFDMALQADGGREELGFLSVFEKESGQYIGLGKIVLFEETWIEVGYALHPGFWGLGYATEITQALVAYARALGYVNQLIALVMPANAASVQVLTRQGFRFFRKVGEGDNARHDYVLHL
jgi:[ribosomal protein S5]-alanine N-acetyltransferase